MAKPGKKKKNILKPILALGAGASTSYAAGKVYGNMRNRARIYETIVKPGRSELAKQVRRANEASTPIGDLLRRSSKKAKPLIFKVKEIVKPGRRALVKRMRMAYFSETPIGFLLRKLKRKSKPLISKVRENDYAGNLGGTLRGLADVTKRTIRKGINLGKAGKYTTKVRRLLTRLLSRFKG